MHPFWRTFRNGLTGAILLVAPWTGRSATYTVTTQADSGVGSFRWALTNANFNPGPDNIHFNITADIGAITVLAASPWPTILQPVFIDGYTQPGAAANTLAVGNDANVIIELATTANIAVGLRVNARGCTIRGVAINGFATCLSLGIPDSGIAGNNVIEGNFIGLRADGADTNSIRSSVGIEVLSTNNLIGGMFPAARNIVSWMRAEGLRFAGGGNYNTVQGNYIGTDRHGLAPIANQWGIQLGGTHHNLIGGLTAETRNVISGNNVGITQTSETGSNHAIQGNFIGLDAWGSAPLANVTGVFLGAPNNVVGGLTATPGSPPGNVISGNSQGGISASGSGTIIQGNILGADASGTLPLSNGAFGATVDGPYATVGGGIPGAGNLIGGNGDAGLKLASDWNTVAGNWIGTDPSQSIDLGNASHGIRVVGKGNAILSNTIAFNGSNGIALIGLFGTSNNLISANSIYFNGQLGIDLGTNSVPDGVDANDSCDFDTGGPNRKQNAPVLTAVTNTGSTLFIAGDLNSQANTPYTIEFFASPQCDPSGYGEGQIYLGDIQIDTDIYCAAGFSIIFDESALPHPVPPCWAVTATARDTNGNTSEFSACQIVDGSPSADLQVLVTATPEPVTIHSNVTYRLFVTNQGPCTANGVQLQHFIGEGTTFISADGCGQSGPFISCALGTLAPGESALRTVVLSYGFVGNAGATFVVLLDDTDPNYADNSVFVNTVVDGKPIVKVSPSDTNAVLGATVAFCAEVGGPGPFTFQWRRNGVNLPGETNICIHIDGVELSDGGTYTVVVANQYGAVVSPEALLRLDLPALQGADERGDRTDIGGFGGFLVGKNEAATVEPTEPRHFGKRGGRSVWYSWVSPNTGIATFRTVGSSFDTLLAIYVECSESNLVEVASDDDRGVNLTSIVQFNALAGTNYLIAIDGFDGAAGDFALTWGFEQTTSLLPVILSHPENATVKPGDIATFSIGAIAGCLDSRHGCDGHHGSCTLGAQIEYQWLFNGAVIPGAVLASYSIMVTETNVGNYSVRVSQGPRSTESRVASLQVNTTGTEIQEAQAHNKWADAAESAGIELGGFTLPPPPPPRGAGPGAAALNTVVRGYSGTQIFNTTAGTTEPGDQLICNVLGGASQWIIFVPLESGVLHLNTDGSTYNTVLAVFRRSLANPAILQFIDCDNNSGQDGRDSALFLPVEAGVTNFVMVDGVNGATGILHLNYSLVTSTALMPLGLNGLGQPQFRLTGHPDMHFTVETSLDMSIWLPIFTNTSPEAIFDFTDTAPSPQHRFYRAVMLP